MKKITLVAAALLSAAIVFQSCSKEEGCTDSAALNFNQDAEEDDGSCEYPPVTPDSVDFVLEFNAKAGSEDLVYGQSYTDTSGAIYRYSLAQFYVSKIQLMGMNNEPLESFDDVYLLVKPEQKSYPIGKVAPGHKHMLAFNVGIDSLTNNQTESIFASYVADDARSIQSPAMHWSWLTGYIFLKIEGEIDVDGDGNFDSTFFAHAGLDELLQRPMIMSHQDAVVGETLTVSLDADFNAVFNQTGVSGVPRTMTMGSPAAKSLATTIITDFSSSITPTP